MKEYFLKERHAVVLAIFLLAVLESEPFMVRAVLNTWWEKDERIIFGLIKASHAGIIHLLWLSLLLVVLEGTDTGWKKYNFFGVMKARDASIHLPRLSS